MNEYSQWEFMLNGNPQEFRHLSERPHTGYFSIYGGVDHWLDCPNDDFRMASIYCEGEIDSGAAWQIGHELISIFNGAGVLFSRDYHKASIFRLLHIEKEVPYEPHRGATALLGRPPFPEARLTDDFNNAKKNNIKLQLLHLATENKDAYFIPKYLDMELGWSTYYKLLEAIEDFAKNKGINLNTNGAQKKSFTNTANNFSLSGFDSRHGFIEITKKNNTAAMTIAEAYEFISKMAKQYLKEAYFSPGA